MESEFESEADFAVASASFFFFLASTLDIDSMPPATTTSARPSWICWAPRTMAFIPEEQTLFTVVQITESGSEAALAANADAYAAMLLAEGVAPEDAQVCMHAFTPRAACIHTCSRRREWFHLGGWCWRRCC